MKKITLLLISLPIFAMAGLDYSQIKGVLLSIKFSNSLDKSLVFYTQDKSLKKREEIIFSSLLDADIILFPENSNKKITVVNSYGKLKSDKKSIGAIYLKKGRTQIIFIRERLKNNGFKLKKGFEKYLVSECQVENRCLSF